MQHKTDPVPQEILPAKACWDRIGVQGDRSCTRLAEAGHCRNCSVFAEAGQRLFEREAPPDYLDQWTRQLAEVGSVAATDAISLLLLRVGPEWLALEAGCVVEIISPRGIHRVPHRTDRLLLGLANIRGELQLCVSLSELLGIERLPLSETHGTTSQPRMIVAEHEQKRWVFPVDEVDGVCRIPTDAMESLPYTVERSARYYCKALFRQDQKRVGTLSVQRLFQALARIIR
jgi:chemotaxis-related protein WspD